MISFFFVCVVFAPAFCTNPPCLSDYPAAGHVPTKLSKRLQNVLSKLPKQTSCRVSESLTSQWLLSWFNSVRSWGRYKPSRAADQQPCIYIHQLTDWVGGWITGWLGDWLPFSWRQQSRKSHSPHWLTRPADWLADWLTGWLEGWMDDYSLMALPLSSWWTCWLNSWLNNWLRDWPTNWPIDWLNKGINYNITNSKTAQ